MTAAKGFPAFPPQRAGARFATSWWGRAWLKALEDTSLDHTLLAKGRAYAKTGQLGPITVSEGRIAAMASDEYAAVVHISPLPDWDRFLEQVAAKAGHLAALLDGDMPYDLVELLPGVGDLEPDCDCPDWGHPCKHAAALCYQASWLLDRDPFLLMLMRAWTRTTCSPRSSGPPLPRARRSRRPTPTASRPCPASYPRNCRLPSRWRWSPRPASTPPPCGCWPPTPRCAPASC
ncbi:hypothetical protein GCM10010404_75060 [Nonomuraea africana]|uniref:SWIM-type domain-containing protein n=1 Tax=Nonomuraea africana TaxID=46171 RepID=A0ABR9KD18_9ACTN|nr:SWIM zinc finger family protein [Nonomuraea africana]MBE1559911.1 hypothetical protein [Nonomuraea africana]